MRAASSILLVGWVIGLCAYSEDESSGLGTMNNANAAPPPIAGGGATVANWTPPMGGPAKDLGPDLGLPPAAPGFERYRTPPVTIMPGESTDYAQWITGPLDQDYDVIAITGAQGPGGHHALVYATPEAQEPGFTRLWTEQDQLKTRLMGGVGGEGGASAVLPEGVVFRVKAGNHVLVQTHYLNYYDDPIEGRSVLDIRLEPVDPTKIVASIFSNVDVAVTLAPGAETTMDVSCPVGEDLSFLQISNHMHEYGASTYTEVIDPTGASTMIKDDPSWEWEWALNPNFTPYSVEQPLRVAAGSTIHTQCTWQNTTADPIKFPAEMCVFFGFILSERDITCYAGRWPAPPAMPASGTGAMPNAGLGTASSQSAP